MEVYVSDFNLEKFDMINISMVVVFSKIDKVVKCKVIYKNNVVCKKVCLVKVF